VTNHPIGAIRDKRAPRPDGHQPAEPLAEYKDRPEGASGSKQNDAEPADGIRIDGSDVLARTHANKRQREERPLGPPAEPPLLDVAMIPKRSLPAANHTVVPANGTIPAHAVQICIENDLKCSGAPAPSRSAAAPQRRRCIEGRPLCNDLCPILRENPGAARQIGKCASRRQEMSEIDDPGIGHPSTPHQGSRVTRPEYYSAWPLSATPAFLVCPAWEAIHATLRSP
jgi:hypothetical protein